MQYLNYKSPLIATNALPHQLSKRSYSHHLQVLDAFSRQYQHGFLVKVCRLHLDFFHLNRNPYRNACFNMIDASVQLH